MPSSVHTEPITDSVPKVNDEVAVGADLKFQRRWWRMENGVWVFFLIVIALDLLGFFGRGPMAKAETRTSDGAMHIRYERIARYGTPSVMTVEFGKAADKGGHVELWVSDTLVKDLGNQRVVPQPDRSVLDGSGFLYTFSSTPRPNSIQFALEPSKAGVSELLLRIPGRDEVKLKIFVVP